MSDERERSIVENPVSVAWDLFNRIGEGYGRPVHINAAIAAGVHAGTASKQYNDWRNEQRKKNLPDDDPRDQADVAEEAPPHAEDK